MIVSFFPRSSLPLKPGYADPAHYSYLVSSKDRIGWYSEATGAYIEWSLDGSLISQFSTPAISGMPGIALCDDGNLFASTGSKANTGGVGWSIYMLARERAEWMFLPMSGKWGVLFGCDGTRPVSTTDLSTLTWLERNGQ